MHLKSIAVAALAYVPNALSQQLSRQCFSDVCYSLNIPQDTARSGNGNIYFQIAGPTTYQWIGLGQGNQMAGSNIFVIYADGQGNVTLSARQGVGHVEPQHDTSANVTLLEGSGVKNGRMVANVLCSNCHRWQGGSTDFTSSSGSWIHAARPGDPLDSTDVEETIQQHGDNGAFTWSYSAAKGGQDINPFLTRQGNAGVSSAPPQTSSNGDDGGESDDVPQDPSDTIVTTHAVLASLVFLAFLPTGAILIRIPGIRNAHWIHGGIQVFAYVVFIVAAGLGIYMANLEQVLTEQHPIIGLVLLGLLTFQPALGLRHHLSYKRLQTRTIISHVHIWIGRVIIILGMINGGLGIDLTGDVETGYKAAYAVVAAVMGTAYVGMSIYGEVRRRRLPDKTPVEENGLKTL